MWFGKESSWWFDCTKENQCFFPSDIYSRAKWKFKCWKLLPQTVTRSSHERMRAQTLQSYLVPQIGFTFVQASCILWASVCSNSALWTAGTVILILWSCGKAEKYLQCISWTKIPNCLTYFNRQAVLQQEQLPGVNLGCLSAPPLRTFVGMCWEKYALICLILVSCFLLNIM